MKAKTILIVVFLFTNIFLGYELVKLSTGGNNYIEKAQIDEIVSYLEKNNVSVNVDVPNRTKPLPALLVRYKAFSKKDVSVMFFNNSLKLERPESTDWTSMTNGNITVQLKDNNELHYIDKGISPSKNPDEKASRVMAESFIKKIGIGGSSKFLMDKTADGGYYKFTYGQKYKGLPIYNSYIVITASEAGVSDARVVWFESVKLHSKSTKIISSIEALLKTYQVLKEITDKAAVNRLDQGYYLNISGASSKAVEGTAFPVWKVETDKVVLYINAYDEKLEKMEGSSQ